MSDLYFSYSPSGSPTRDTVIPPYKPPRSKPMAIIGYPMSIHDWEQLRKGIPKDKTSLIYTGSDEV